MHYSINTDLTTQPYINIFYCPNDFKNLYNIVKEKYILVLYIRHIMS